MSEQRIDLDALAAEQRELTGSGGEIYKAHADRSGVMRWQSTCQGFGVGSDGKIYFLGTWVDDAALKTLDLIRRHVAPAPAAPDDRIVCPKCGGDGGVKEDRSVYMYQGVRDCPDCEGSGFIAPPAPDAGLRERIAEVVAKKIHVEYPDEIDPYDITDAIIAALAPRIDGVLVPRELAERAVDACRTVGRMAGANRDDGVAIAAYQDADQLRALLGREGNHA